MYFARHSYEHFIITHYSRLRLMSHFRAAPWLVNSGKLVIVKQMNSTNQINCPLYIMFHKVKIGTKTLISDLCQIFAFVSPRQLTNS